MSVCFYYYQFACKVITALLHYFFLATFTWTMCEAVLIYILLVKVFGANDRKWIYLYLALGWGKQGCLQCPNNDFLSSKSAFNHLFNLSWAMHY